MEKPVIRITKSKGVNRDHPELIYSYALFLPYELWELPEYQKNTHWRERWMLLTSNPNDCLALIICHDIEIGGIRPLGMRLIWDEDIKDFIKY